MGARLCFIGAGAMGSAAIRGLIGQGVYSADELVACDPVAEARERLSAATGVRALEDNPAAVDGAEAVFLAVKPQSLAQVCEGLSGNLLPHQLVISIVAGASLAQLRSALRCEKLVRAMPNTPAQIGRGMTLWTAAAGVNEEDLKTTIRILGALGEEIFTPDEGHLDMATAVSGSGPAYALLVLEAWTDAAVRIGLPRPMAEKLALETIQGTMALVQQTGEHPAALRARVTSPGGTTAAALQELEEGRLRASFGRAIEAAYRRSRELGST